MITIIITLFTYNKKKSLLKNKKIVQCFVLIKIRKKNVLIAKDILLLLKMSEISDIHHHKPRGKYMSFEMQMRSCLLFFVTQSVVLVTSEVHTFNLSPST